MSRAKLEALGLNLPLLPTTSVGSFGKPDDLVAARGQHARNEITQEELQRLEERATEFWVRQQEEIGIDVLVDGEMYRGDMVAYFAQLMGGLTLGGLVRSYGNRYYHKPIIAGEVKWPGPMTVAWWKRTQAMTRRPVKGMLTGPYTIMDWSFNDHYPTRAHAAMALAREIRKEVEALIEAGCKLIQVDEPALSVRAEELPVAIEAMHVVTDGLPAYFFTHVCYGAFEFIYPAMLELPVDNWDLEMSNSGLDLVELFREHPFTKDLSFGIVDVHTHAMEDPDAVKERVARALSVLPAPQVWLDPDCGLKTRTVDETIGKLRLVVDAARAARRSLGGGFATSEGGSAPLPNLPPTDGAGKAGARKRPTNR
jgi:5-methyltetrahydropteroyltriglutamate--homocysteine methyltransferase